MKIISTFVLTILLLGVSFENSKAEEITPVINFRNFSLELIGIFPFSEDRARVLVKGSDEKLKWGFIDDMGSLVIFPDYTSADDYKEGMAGVCKGDLYRDHSCGYIDKEGKTVIDFNYFSVNGFSEGLGVVSSLIGDDGDKSNKWNGVIDKQGRRVINFGKFVYANAKKNYFSEGLLGLSISPSGAMFIDSHGVTKLKWENAKVNQFSEGLAVFEVNGLKGYIDRQGNTIIKPIYELAWDFRDGLARVMKDKKEYIIDKFGKTVLNPNGKFDGYGEGLYGFKSNSKGALMWGYIDKSGKNIIPPKFSFTGQFSESKAAVQDKDADGIFWRIINKSGETKFVIR